MDNLSAQPAAEAYQGVHETGARPGSATQTSVSQCILAWNGMSEPPSPADGMVITNSSFTQVADTQCNGFNTGITVQSASSGLTNVASFTGVRVSSQGSCVAVRPTVFDVSFVDCSFQAATDWPPSGATLVPGILIGQSGGTDREVDTVRFTSCTLGGNSGISNTAFYGLQIESGQNIQINGGSYSGNGDGAGIAILGGTAIQINGANCIGLSEFTSPAPPSTPTPTWQLYGVYISAGSSIQLLNVNCSGSGLSTTWPGTGIYIAGSSGSVQGVQIIGALCTAPVLEGDTPNQEYGIYASDASDLMIVGCTLTANTGAGIYLENVTDVTICSCDVTANAPGIFVGDGSTDVFIRSCNVTPASSGTAIGFGSSSDLSNVQVTDCAGYNDQPTPPLYGPTTTLPSGPFNGVTYGHYGPTTFYVSDASSISIDDTITGLTSGGFTLAPGESAEISASGGAANFFMVGN